MEGFTPDACIFKIIHLIDDVRIHMQRFLRLSLIYAEWTHTVDFAKTYYYLFNIGLLGMS